MKSVALLGLILVSLQFNAPVSSANDSAPRRMWDDPVTTTDDKNPPKVTFAKLHDALSFIDQKLDHDDWDALKSSLYPPFQEGQKYRSDEWPHMKSTRGEKRLTEIFADKEFPSSGSIYRFRLAWTVLTFIRTPSGWSINAVFGVR